MNKIRYQLTFISSGSEKELKAIEKVVSLIVNLISLVNKESIEGGLHLRAKLKEKS